MGGRERLRDLARLTRLGAVNVGRALLAEDLRLRALALTAITLFALVPALMVAFSFLHSFAGMDVIQRRAQDYLIANLAVGARATVETYLHRFLKNAQGAGLGAVGGVLLVASAVSLLTNVERALNDLWAVRRQRPLVQKALIYWAALTLGPVLLAASLALAHRVQAEVAPASARALESAASLALVCLFFALLYVIVPATRVRLGAALAGGVLAGLAWEGAKGLYALALTRFIRYDAIYGSVAALPIFIVWLYISWTILLFGARVAFVVQHARHLVRWRPADLTPLGRELLAARALLEVARAHHRGAPPPDSAEVATALEVPAEPVRDLVAQLRAGGLVLEAQGGGLAPARPLDQLSPADVRQAISGGVPRPGGAPGEALLGSILAEAEGAAARTLSGVTYAELCRALEPRVEPDAGRQPGGTLADFGPLG